MRREGSCRAAWPALLLGLVLILGGGQRAEAFCGFYVSGATGELFNNATQVVMMREGMRTVLSMQNNYQGPPEDFAMVIPVPVVLQKENVKTLDKELFKKIDQMTAPRLVEYWESDPCAPILKGGLGLVGTGRGGGGMSFGRIGGLGGGVKVEAQFEVGEYEIVVLSAQDSNGLDEWLREHKYNIPEGAEPVLRPYVESGTKFFVAKVNSKKVKFNKGQAELSPLRFHYDSQDFNLPIRLGLLNANGPQDLIVNILARGQRYEVANYPNTTIPTNLVVKEEVKDRFAEFYAALFDQTVQQHPGAVITEYAWDANTCDPCPGPTLNPADFLKLGADTLKNRNTSGFVLTRLHTRYTKENLGPDLIFRAAPPILGGRGTPDTKGEFQEEGSQPGERNNFQGRYAVLHFWDKPIKCQEPQRGQWWGNPNGPGGSVRPRTAQKLSTAPRGKLQLASVLKSPLPAPVPAAPAQQPPAPPSPQEEEVKEQAAAPQPPAPEATAPPAQAPKAQEAPKVKDSDPAMEGKSGGCAQAPGSGLPSPWMGLLLGAALWLRRRRSSR